jgi:hypothetical protein
MNNAIHLDEIYSPFERALFEALTSGQYDARDQPAVVHALEYAPVGVIPRQHLAAMADAWLTAATVLRREDLPRNTETMAKVVAAGAGWPAEHAAKMLARIAMRAAANDGVEPPANDDYSQVKPRGLGRVVRRAR